MGSRLERVGSGAAPLFVFFVSHASQHVRPTVLTKTTVMSMPKSCEVTNMEKKRTELALRSG